MNVVKEKPSAFFLESLQPRCERARALALLMHAIIGVRATVDWEIA